MRYPTPEIIARRAAILAVARRHPDWTYAAIAEGVWGMGHARPAKSTVHAICHQFMPTLDPNWRKVNRHHRTYVCQDCGAAFAGRRGYSGGQAKRCATCRGRKDRADGE